MEVIPSRINSHASLPRLSTSKHSHRRDSQSSSRTRDSGYNSDPDSLSPLEIGGLDQDLCLAPLPCVPSIFHSIKATPFQSGVGFDRSRLFGRDILPSDPAKAVAGRRIPRSFPDAPELAIVACDGSSETLKAQRASQDEEIEKWVNENLPSSNKPEQRSLSITSLSSTSSCDMYTSTDVSDDEYEYEKGHVVPRQAKSTAKVIELIVRKVEISLRHAAYKQCGGKDTSNTHTAVSIPTSQNSGKTWLGSGSKRKARQDSSPPDDEDGEGSPNKRRRGSVTASDESEMGTRFACPFYKHDPNRYRNRRTCPGPGWTTVHRMKEHLYRSHAQPIFCPICYATFKSDREQSNHVRLQQCERSLPQQIDGIDRETVWTLRKRTTALRLEEDKWRDVYQILFPHVPAADIPSPFYDCDSPSEASRRFRRDLLRRVQEELYAEAEQMPGPIEQQLLQRVAQIVRRCEQELVNQARPTFTADFNTDRRPSASSIGSSYYQATPASGLSPPSTVTTTTTTTTTAQRPPTPVAPVQVQYSQTHTTMALQGTMQYIPEPAADFSQIAWDDQSYNPFSLGIDWDDVFSSAPTLQYRSSDEPAAAVFSKPMWT